MLACDAAGQHEDGNIGAADEQEQKYGAEEHEERTLKVAEDLLVESHNAYLPPLRKVGGVLLGVAVDEWLQLGDETLVGCTGLEFDEGQHVVVRIGLEVAGEVNLAIAPGEAGIGNADDGVERVVKLDGFADDAGLAAILLLPEEIAEYSNGAGVAAGSVGGGELAAQQRRYAHVGEEVGRVAANIDRDGEAVAGQRLPGLVHQEHIVYGRKLLNVFEFGGRDGKKATVRRRLVAKFDVNHAVGVFVGVG